ncbi:fructose-bisphosphate aldolase [Actinospica durhamensis]|uniref:Fructose-bisphosphate aldolase n=1 Tax=Actinospica durhamensis TaxID=1508375 RepID=A0A941F1I8_9ACTN|nr:fructose-bisphosphate aldolase [Actinospica durhamensis]
MSQNGQVSVRADVQTGVTGTEQPRQWAARAASAERAVLTRHMRRLWGLPGTLLGVSAAPATPAQRWFGPWNYWWQAQLLDCLVDAHLRAPTPARRARVEQTVHGIRVRNARGWHNDYCDDMAWLALALDRARRHVLGRTPRTTRALGTLSAALYQAWTEDAGGGIWWRSREKYREDFKNVPANGPAAILFARLREPRAYETAHWIEEHLVDPFTGVVWDGLHASPHGGIREIETTPYTYNQGVFLGACLELAAWDRDGAEAELWADRAVRTIEAVAERLTVPPVVLESGGTRTYTRTNILRGQGGGDGGLFAGILARYLAQAALALPAFGPAYEPAARTAAELVLGSARAAWNHAAWGAPVGCFGAWRSAATASTGPVFGHDWSVPARLPRNGGVAERELSVQVGAWTLLESAALLSRTGAGPAAADATRGRGAARPRGRAARMGRNLGRVQSLYSP